MDTQALQKTLREFAAVRHWQPFHTPKNLSTALMVEAAELAEIFQWMTPEESQAAHLYPDKKECIADEIADVLLYLLQVADHCAVEIDRAVADKLIKNAIKHPVPVLVNRSVVVAAAAEQAVERTQQSMSQVNEQAGPSTSRTHVLVDWENVQPADVDIRKLVSDVSDVWLFHGPNQKNVATNQALFGQQVTLIPIARSGKNALDFHLSFYMGYIASRNPNAHFVVISNDKGYLPMLEHARTLGFSVRQVGFEKATDIAKQVSVKNAAVKKVPVKQISPKTVKVAEKPSGAAATKVTSASKPMPVKVATIPKKTPAGKRPGKTVAKPVLPVAVKKSIPKKKSKPSKDLGQATQHVRDSLAKMTNKPTRKSRLLAAIQSLLNEPASEAERANEVMQHLEKTQFLNVDDKGKVVFSS